ncbi:MAG: DUF1059 domain-containing protein [Bacteroidota bacterium]
MKTLSCRAVGSFDCDFVAKEETAEEVKKAAFAHAEQVHKDALQKMSPEDIRNITEKMDSLLK